MDFLLPVCISLAVLGLVIAVVLWLRDRRGRAAQALGLAVLPIGLYLTGLLALVWNAGAALVRWSGQLILNPAVWTGLGLIGLAVVLWVAGGVAARRTRRRRSVGKATARPGVPASSTGPASPERTPAKAPAKTPAKTTGSGAAAEEFDDIEAILRKHGID